MSRETPSVGSPDRVLLIGGVKRSGTSLMRNLIGSHSDIAIPPVEFGFFIDYSVAEFDHPDGYSKAVEKFNKGSRPERWSLRGEAVGETGRTARDFYCAALDTYRRANKPTARYFGDKSTFIEREFERYREWFGLERIRFIHMVRNPFDCYASTKKIPHLKHWPSYAVYHFCEDWARSIVLGLSLAQRYPSSYRVVRYEDLVTNPATVVADLCAWMGVPDETERMLACSDYERKSNSSFGDVTGGDDAKAGSVVNVPAGSRLKHLNDREFAAIQAMAVGELLPLLGYDAIAGRSDRPVTDHLSDAIRHYLNLAGLKKGLPAYFRLLGTATTTLLSMVIDRIRRS
jgi:hypothetical protein